MSLVAWFLLLVFQNAAFTWVSRARNSGSYSYHAIAAVFSNGIFFYTNIILIALMTKFFADSTQSMWALLYYGSIYIAGTVTGSVLMHWIAVRWLETGKRKVGT